MAAETSEQTALQRPEYIVPSGVKDGGTVEQYLAPAFSLELPAPGKDETAEDRLLRVRGFKIEDEEVTLSDELCTKVAVNLLEAVNADQKRQITIQFMSQDNPASWQIIQKVRTIAEAAGKVVVTFDLGVRERELLLGIDRRLQAKTITEVQARKELENYARYEEDLLGASREDTGVICFRDELPYLYKDISDEVQSWRAETRNEALRTRVDKRDWTLDGMDTPDLVEVDNLNLHDVEPDQTLEDYLVRWVANERRNWREVSYAHEYLLQTLNRGHRFRIVDYKEEANPLDPDRFISDMTFVTRKTDGNRFRPRLWYNQAGGPSKNTGSEVFVGPSTDEEAVDFAGGAVHGKIVYQSAVHYCGGVIPPGLTLYFDHGKLVGWYLPGDTEAAQKAREHFNFYVKERGMLRFGELGYGTNPIFRVSPRNKYKGRATSKTLDAEKAGPHMAFGECYPNEVDELQNLDPTRQRIADLDNGNHSDHHEDLVHSLIAGMTSDKWVDIGDYDAEGVYHESWVLIERNGVFMDREWRDGQWWYKPSKAMEILSSPVEEWEWDQEFTASYPPEGQELSMPEYVLDPKRKILSREQMGAMDTLRENMQQQNLNALLVTDPAAIAQATGFVGLEPQDREAMLLVTPDNMTLLTRPLYYEQVPNGVEAKDLAELPHILESVRQQGQPQKIGVQIYNLTVDERQQIERIGDVQLERVILPEFAQTAELAFPQMPEIKQLTQAHARRIVALQDALDAGVGGLLVSEPSAVRYYTGINFPALALVTGGEVHIYTEDKYTGRIPEQLANNAHSMQDFVNSIASVLKKVGNTRLGIESYNLSVARENVLREADIETVGLPLVTEQRAIKSDEELEMLEEACDATNEAYEYALSLLRNDVTEVEVRDAVEGFMKERGYAPAFPTLFAFGSATQSPHYATGSQELTPESPITIDMGFEKVRGSEDELASSLPSDITYSLWWGTNPPEAYVHMYETVLGAHVAVHNYLASNQQAIAAGEITGQMVDKVARDHILGQGYTNADFPHGLGHGLGSWQVHAAPFAGSRSREVLRRGHVVTNEPGIYRAGMGVRIERDIKLLAEGVQAIPPLDPRLLMIDPETGEHRYREIHF